jgi:hypothetical protein
LTRTVGYKIVRSGVVPVPRKPGPQFPVDWDDMARPIIRAANPYTMTRAEKRYALYLSTRYITRYEIPGAVVECGVWRGGSMHIVARTLMKVGDPTRDLYLFDTFEGMTPPTEKDVTYDGKAVADLLAQRPKTSKIWAIASLEDVQEGMATVGYPGELIHYVKGPVEETLPDAAPQQIALLRLDTDWYESTRHELHTLYDRLVPGGVLIVDDYGSYQGSRQAVDEFIEETGARLLLVPIGPGRIAIKQ